MCFGTLVKKLPKCTTSHYAFVGLFIFNANPVLGFSYRVAVICAAGVSEKLAIIFTFEVNRHSKSAKPLTRACPYSYLEDECSKLIRNVFNTVYNNRCKILKIRSTSREFKSYWYTDSVLKGVVKNEINLMKELNGAESRTRLYFMKRFG